MPPRGSIQSLPADVREWLEGELVRSGFANYRHLTDQLNERLEQAGEGPVSKSAVHRYGKTIEERIEALRRSTEVARTLAREAGDDEGALTDAVQRLVQDRLFNLVLEMEIDPDKVDIIKLGHLAADLGRASIAQKKWQAAMAQKAREVAEQVTAQVRKAGLSEDASERIRRDILGIAA